VVGWKTVNDLFCYNTISDLEKTGTGAYHETVLKSDKLWCTSVVVDFVGL